jgi:hypothetical protein
MTTEKSGELLKRLEGNLPVPVPSTPLPPKEEKEIQDDYEFSRRTYKDLVDKSNTAIDGMMELALQSEHPRAFEVLSIMLKNTSDMTDKLMSLQKNKKDLKKEEKGVAAGVTNNNLFLGSVTDLQKHLRQELVEKNITDTTNNAT